MIQDSTRFADQNTFQDHFRWLNGRNPRRIEKLMFQFQHKLLRDASWGKLPVESERTLVRLWSVSNVTSVSAQATTNNALPLEADSSSSIAPQSDIVFSSDRRRVISPCKTNAVAFCAPTGTTVGMYRMSIYEELGIGQTNYLEESHRVTHPSS